MNRQQYQELQATVPNFDKAYVLEVDPNNVIEDKQTSQIRQKGHVIKKVPAMVSDIQTNGQEVPADVRRLPNGQYELKDGITRWLAQRKIKGGKLKVSIYHDTLFKTDDDWLFHQVRANEHETTTSNSKHDIEYQIAKALKTGALERKLGYKYLGNEVRFMKEAPDFLKGVYKRTSVTKKTIENFIQKCVNKSSLVLNRYHNYTKGTGGNCWQFFSAHNTLGWSGIKTNDICNNVSVYAMYDPGEVKDIAGYVWKKSAKNPNADYYLIAWVGNLSNKNDNGIKTARQKIYDAYKTDLQNHPKFKVPMFKGIYFLPQIKTGQNKENLNKLYLPRQLGLT